MMHCITLTAVMVHKLLLTPDRDEAFFFLFFNHIFIGFFDHFVKTTVQLKPITHSACSKQKSLILRFSGFTLKSSGCMCNMHIFTSTGKTFFLSFFKSAPGLLSRTLGDPDRATYNGIG